MRILLLSFSYPPDIGPGSLRAKSIVDALLKKGPSDLKIKVITTMPNRYHTLEISASQYERNKKVSIQRINLPKHKNGTFDQVKAFISYALAVRKLISNKTFDIIVVTSSRLMTASLGAWVSKKTKSKLYLDIRDLFTDTMDSLLKDKPLRIFMPFFYILENWTIKSAKKLNVVSPAFANYITKISPDLSPSTYTNGVDKLFLGQNYSTNKKKIKPLILYIGNIGDGQGLDKIIPRASMEFKEINFKLIGDGSAKKALTDNRLFRLQTNIEVLKPVKRNELIKEYKNADILFLHLNDYKAFHKVLPSKIFEYAATGKPILAGVAGFAGKFLKNNVKGVEIFYPGDINGMKLGLQRLLNGPNIIDRTDFCKNYSREKIMQKLSEDILSLY